MAKPQKSPQLKHGLGREAIERLARNVARASSSFDVKSFVSASTRGLSPLELKQRVAHVAEVLAEHLPASYPKALAIVVKAEKAWDRGDPDDPYRGFAAWPLFHFIEMRGQDDLDRSMEALRRLTHLFSAEFAVRPFLRLYPGPALERLAEWCDDPSADVRRLVSEGTRPRLPWAGRLPAFQRDPAPVLVLLERLKDDPSECVRRSVANNLNDIGKDHPERLLEVCSRWSADAAPERQWVIRRATRSLVKAGHPGVWKLLGVSERAHVKVADLRARPKRVPFGGETELSFRVRSTATSSQRVVVDFAVHYVKANGQTRPKVFKLRELDLAPGEEVALGKRISFRPISTRRYYPGVHRVEVLVNGTPSASTEVRLLSAPRA